MLVQFSFFVYLSPRFCSDLLCVIMSCKFFSNSIPTSYLTRKYPRRPGPGNTLGYIYQGVDFFHHCCRPNNFLEFFLILWNLGLTLKARSSAPGMQGVKGRLWLHFVLNEPYLLTTFFDSVKIFLMEEWDSLTDGSTDTRECWNS